MNYWLSISVLLTHFDLLTHPFNYLFHTLRGFSSDWHLHYPDILKNFLAEIFSIEMR